MKEENKIRKNLYNDNCYWWLRSAYSRGGIVACVYRIGYVYSSDYDNRIGVVPSFII